jgi:UDP-N-acetylmuramoyl-tripeptide--D-alanyl-D-alanine ligase
MPIKINSQQVAKIINGVHFNDSVDVVGVSIDSRTVDRKNLFFALKGEKFDGNKFIDAAYINGASVCIGNENIKTNKAYIKVADTYKAFVSLAKYYRKSNKAKVIGITGSCGKTTVKEMLKNILQKKNKTFATLGNLNNEIGVPLSILQSNKSDAFLILEMGANHLGEIKRLSGIATPNLVAITNIHPAHIGCFGSLENIAKAKSEIMSNLADDSFVVLNSGSNHFDILKEKANKHNLITIGIKENDDFKLIEDNSFVYNDKKYTLFLQNLIFHNQQNALLSLAIATICGENIQTSLKTLADFSSVAGRLEKKQTKEKMLIIDDTYNANPASMRVAIDYLALQRQPTKWALLGDMAELGEKSKEEHIKIAMYAKEKNINKLFVVGKYAPVMARIFGDKCYIENIVADIKKGASADIALLVKGSRSTRMDQYVESLLC